MTAKKLQKCFGDMYLGKQNSTYVLFILGNIRINCHMNAGGFKGLLYNMFS